MNGGRLPYPDTSCREAAPGNYERAFPPEHRVADNDEASASLGVGPRPPTAESRRRVMPACDFWMSVSLMRPGLLAEQ